MTRKKTAPEVLVTHREFRALLAEAEVTRLARTFGLTNAGSLRPEHRKAIGRALVKPEKSSEK